MPTTQRSSKLLTTLKHLASPKEAAERERAAWPARPRFVKSAGPVSKPAAGNITPSRREVLDRPARAWKRAAGFASLAPLAGGMARHKIIANHSRFPELKLGRVA